MRRPDDSTLLLDQLMATEARAKLSLDKAAAWGRFPTPVDDILAAANLRVSPKGMFDPASFLAFVKGKAASAKHTLKTALSKILGLYDANEHTIHIDESVGVSKQKFLKLHETGHHELPWHRKIFSLFQDCEETLAPAVADQFEREANNFARFALFQGAAFKDHAADMKMGIRTPMDLAKKFGASNYASAREFARTHHRPCVVYVLERMEYVPGHGTKAAVRRIETSPSFELEFGKPDDLVIDANHSLAPLLPIGRKMTKPKRLLFLDKNGVRQECLGEAFDTTHNVLLLIYPTQALLRTSIWVPASFNVTSV